MLLTRLWPASTAFKPIKPLQFLKSAGEAAYDDELGMDFDYANVSKISSVIISLCAP